MADALTLMPTLEDTMRELVTNRYLANIVRLPMFLVRLLEDKPWRSRKGVLMGIVYHID